MLCRETRKTDAIEHHFCGSKTKARHEDVASNKLLKKPIAEPQSAPTSTRKNN